MGSVYKPLQLQKLVFASDFEYSFREWKIKTLKILMYVSYDFVAYLIFCFSVFNLSAGRIFVLKYPKTFLFFQILCRVPIARWFEFSHVKSHVSRNK